MVAAVKNVLQVAPKGAVIVVESTISPGTIDRYVKPVIREQGFELGVDDYVVKPFSPRELMMRVGAVLRRLQAPGAAGNAHETVTVENMLVDFTARQVTIDGTEVELSPKEYDLLFFMVRNRGIALTRDRLISEVWGYDFFGDDRTLDTHIKLLRKQLGDYARYITTLRGVGYRFEKE